MPALGHWLGSGEDRVWSTGFGFLQDPSAISFTGCLATRHQMTLSPHWNLLTQRGPVVITGDNAKKAPSAGLDTERVKEEILAIIAINITYGLDPYIMNTSKNSIKLKITET